MNLIVSKYIYIIKYIVLSQLFRAIQIKNNEKILKQKIKNNNYLMKKNQKQNKKYNKNVNIDQKMYMKYNSMSNVKLQKSIERREGDWICKYCNNLNFAFRKKCNKCKMDKINYNYNSINN
jgi:hypothetical protein